MPAIVTLLGGGSTWNAYNTSAPVTTSSSLYVLYELNETGGDKTVAPDLFNYSEAQEVVWSVNFPDLPLTLDKGPQNELFISGERNFDPTFSLYGSDGSLIWDAGFTLPGFAELADVTFDSTSTVYAAFNDDDANFYIVTIDGTVTTLQLPIKLDYTVSNVVLDPDELYFYLLTESYIGKYEIATGAVVWELTDYTYDPDPKRNAFVINGALYCYDYNYDAVVKLNKDTGEQLAYKDYYSGVIDGISYYETFFTIDDEGNIYVAYQQTLYKLDADLNTTWEVTIPAPADTSFYQAILPLYIIYVNKKVTLHLESNAIYQYDSDDGKLTLQLEAKRDENEWFGPSTVDLSNNIYVDIRSNFSEQFRIQKFSSSGELLAEIFPPIVSGVDYVAKVMVTK